MHGLFRTIVYLGYIWKTKRPQASKEFVVLHPIHSGLWCVRNWMHIVRVRVSLTGFLVNFITTKKLRDWHVFRSCLNRVWHHWDLFICPCLFCFRPAIKRVSEFLCYLNGIYLSVVEWEQFMMQVAFFRPLENANATSIFNNLTHSNPHSVMLFVRAPLSFSVVSIVIVQFLQWLLSCLYTQPALFRTLPRVQPIQ